jgi:chromosome segregation ATPase
MQTYLPIIKTILSDWFQLTLTYPLYAAALATVVFLLTAILYSIKVASLNKKNIASEKARIEMQDNLNAELNTAQQQIQKMQEELTANTEQMQLAQKEAERTARFEELLTQRNKQVAGVIQSMATSFDLGERPLPVMGDIKAEGLWQQHDRVITLLTTRLRSEEQAKMELQQSYQAETLKRAEIEALIETLQTTLATQTSQVSTLEQALEEQKSMLQQQQDKAQQVLSQTLEKHLSELAHLTELEQQALDLVNTRQQLTQLEEKLKAKDALITQLEKDKLVDQIKIQPALIKQDEKETVIELQKTDEEVPPAPSDIEQQPVSPVKEQTGGVAGKLKSLFGKTVQEPMTAEPKSVETRQGEEEIQPASVDMEQPPVSAAKAQFGKLKSLFGSAKQQPEETIQDEEKIQPASVDMEQSPVSAAKAQFGKLKSLFGSAKQQPEETIQDEEEIQLAAVDMEQPPVSAAKSQFGKLKNLFGKTR